MALSADGRVFPFRHGLDFEQARLTCESIPPDIPAFRCYQCHPFKIIPGKVRKPILWHCLCGSRASGLDNLVQFTLTTVVSINHNLAVPLYLIPCGQ